MTALYDSEKSQNLALEEAVAAEKENFNKVKTIMIKTMTTKTTTPTWSKQSEKIDPTLDKRLLVKS